MSYHDNVATIARNEDNALNAYLDARYDVEHEQTVQCPIHLCGLCLEVVVNEEGEYCEECK